MYALLINGSPHAKGCTYTAFSEVAKALEEDGIETEILHVGNKNIRGCIACRSCQKTGKCVFDDLVNETAPKFEKANAVIVGSPVYYAAPAGTLISFLDRLFYSTSAVDKRMKVGASVVSCRRGGNSSTFDVLNKYFTISNMPVAASQYWNMVYGTNAEEVKKDLEGLQTMRTLGHNVAFLVKSIAAEKEKNGLPDTEKHIFTNFHH